MLTLPNTQQQLAVLNVLCFFLRFSSHYPTATQFSSSLSRPHFLFFSHCTPPQQTQALLGFHYSPEAADPRAPTSLCLLRAVPLLPNCSPSEHLPQGDSQAPHTQDLLPNISILHHMKTPSALQFPPYTQLLELGTWESSLGPTSS